MNRYLKKNYNKCVTYNCRNSIKIISIYDEDIYQKNIIALINS